MELNLLSQKKLIYFFYIACINKFLSSYFLLRFSLVIDSVAKKGKKACKKVKDHRAGTIQNIRKKLTILTLKWIWNVNDLAESWKSPWANFGG